MRIQVSLVASHRIGGKVTHEHVASFGSISDPASVRERLEFWNSLQQRLGGLGKRTNGVDVGKLLANVHKRIPIVKPEEQRELALERGRDETSIEDSLRRDRASFDPKSSLINSLNEAFQAAQEEKVCEVLSAAIKASNKTRLAIECRNNRTTLYRAFQIGRRPNFLTVLNVLHALDVRIGCYSRQSATVDKGIDSRLAQINEGFRTTDIKSVCDAFGALIGAQSNFTTLANQLTMSRTSLYRWRRSGRSPTLRSILDLATALQLELRIYKP